MVTHFPFFKTLQDGKAHEFQDFWAPDSEVCPECGAADFFGKLPEKEMPKNAPSRQATRLKFVDSSRTML